MNRVGRLLSQSLCVCAVVLAAAASAAPITVTTPPPATPPAVTAAPAPPATSAPDAAKIDINSATADQLATLPGIGKARSAAIVSGRPYKRKDELVKRKIIPASVYTQIKTQIIASQS